MVYRFMRHHCNKERNANIATAYVAESDVRCWEQRLDQDVKADMNTQTHDLEAAPFGS